MRDRVGGRLDRRASTLVATFVGQGCLPGRSSANRPALLWVAVMDPERAPSVVANAELTPEAIAPCDIATSPDPGTSAARAPRPAATPAWIPPRVRTTSVLTESGSTTTYLHCVLVDSNAAVQAIRAARFLIRMSGDWGRFRRSCAHSPGPSGRTHSRLVHITGPESLLPVNPRAEPRRRRLVARWHSARRVQLP